MGKGKGYDDVSHLKADIYAFACKRMQAMQIMIIKKEKENDNDHVNANEIRFAQNLSFFVENHVENSKKPSKIKSLHCGKLCGKCVKLC